MRSIILGLAPLLSAPILAAVPAQVSSLADASQAVVPVTCWTASTTANRAGRGTAFYLADGAVTASHVLNTDKCEADGRPLRVAELKRDVDVARILPRISRSPQPLVTQVQCTPLNMQESYVALGYFQGRLRAVRLRITGSRVNADEYSGFPATALNTYEMVGETDEEKVLPGMSGGPLFDQNWRVVGIIIATSTNSGSSFIRSVTDTSLCRGAPLPAVLAERLSPPSRPGGGTGR